MILTIIINAAIYSNTLVKINGVINFDIIDRFLYLVFFYNTNLILRIKNYFSIKLCKKGANGCSGHGEHKNKEKKGHNAMVICDCRKMVNGQGWVHIDSDECG